VLKKAVLTAAKNGRSEHYPREHEDFCLPHQRRRINLAQQDFVTASAGSTPAFFRKVIIGHQFVIAD
jgi:hypothetical protein